MTVHRPAGIRSTRDGLLMRAGLAAAGMVATAGVFAVVTALVIDRHAAVVDNRVLGEAVEHRAGPWTWFFEAVSTAAEIPLTVLVVALAAVLARWRRSWAPLVLAGLTGAGAVVVATVVKNIVGRPRPAAWWQVVPESGFSFPSRHTTVAAALLLIAAYLLARHTSVLVACLIWWPAALALTTLVAASRVYLGVHWATDVTAAAALGTMWALTVITAHLLLRRYSRPRMRALSSPRARTPADDPQTPVRLVGEPDR